jgi:fatty-acyl-CoA synthase
MKALMQDHPLNIPMVVRHAERMHPRKTVTTRTDAGLVTSTYAHVLERARRLIAALRALGVRPDDRVATFCWNHQQHLEAYVGVPCMGAVLHTLNIRLFDADLAYIVEHAQDAVVIVDRSLLPAWEKVAAQVKCVRATIVVPDVAGPLPAGAHDYEALLAAHDPVGELPRVPEDQAAAMCYTSGTTGHPKGVVYSHRSNVLHSMVVLTADALGVCERDVVLPIVPMFHANAWGLPYACLLAGADLVMPGRHLTPGPLLELLVGRGVTLAAGVPSIWTSMLETLTQARPQLGKLRRILCGGSAVPAALQASYRDAVGVSIYQAWGMTETSPLATFCTTTSRHEDLDAEQRAHVLNSQGRAVPLVDLRLVDDDGREVPWDARSPGELQVRGPWIASGYHGDERTDEKFQDGWLRTGDVATVCPEGYVRICDRTKDLVKSGGEWISSVELEALIMAHPAVAEAAVIAVPHPRWCERPLACVVPRPAAKGTLTPEQLIDFLRPRVAKWWLPDDVVFIDEVPKTSVGKFDKKVLRERFKAHVLPEAPRT